MVAVGTALAFTAAVLSAIVSLLSLFLGQTEFAKKAITFAGASAAIGAIGTIATAACAVGTVAAAPVNALKTVSRGGVTLFSSKKEDASVDSDATYDKVYDADSDGLALTS